MLLLVDLLWTGKLPGVLLVLGGVVAAGVAMALSQIALNAHYPTDTVGGFCAALAVVPATAWLVDRFPGQPGTADPTGR
jgi:membrane-associated phospholipid phosphatase